MKVLLDLDNTILDENSGIDAYLPEFFSKYNQYSKNSYDNFKDRWKNSLESYYRQYLDREITFREQRLNRILYSFNNYSLEKSQLDRMYSDYDEIYENSWKIFKEWIPYFQSTQNIHYIITNGTSYQQRKKLKSLKIDHYINEAFISEEVGFSKPSVNFFNHVLQKIESKKNDLIVIGDSYENDIFPSRLLGIKSIWINHTRKQGNLEKDVIEVDTVENAIKILEKFT